MSKPRKRARQERAGPASHQLDVTNENVDAVVKNGTGGFKTPPGGVATVDLEDVRMQVSHLVFDSQGQGDGGTGSALATASPRSTKKHQLEKRTLFPSCRVPHPSWSWREEQALVGFLLLYSSSHSWVSRRGDSAFWDGAARYIQGAVGSVYLRTGKACRARVFKNLCHQFPSPLEAEQHFKCLQATQVPASGAPSQTPLRGTPSATIGLPHTSTSSTLSQSSALCESSSSVPHSSASETPQTRTSRAPSFVGTLTQTSTTGVISQALATGPVTLNLSVGTHSHQASPSDSCRQALLPLQLNEQLRVLTNLFSEVVRLQYSFPTVAPDFLGLVASGMRRLHTEGRSNTIYLLARALGTLRNDGSDSLLPVKRMPMGLIEYTVAFFAASHEQKISCPLDYRLWLQTQYILFGTKWAKLFAGPMWSHEPIMQAGDRVASSSRNPMEALVNVPALSERTLRRDIEKTEISTGPEIQTHMLRKAMESDPNAQWWVKGDGVDVVKGLCESVKGQWSGDVDLNDGKLNSLYQVYQQRLQRISGVGLKDRNSLDLIEADLNAALADLKDDLKFIHSELQEVNSSYEVKQREGNTGEKTMLSLIWDIEELKRLNKEGRHLCTNMLETLDLVRALKVAQREHNLPRKLASIRTCLRDVVKGVFHFKRTPATHMFVLMISSELRNKKPYAIPVQCFQYASLTERDMRHVVTCLVKEMVHLGMSVAGFVSNGEFNYLRSKGYARPLSVLQIRTDVRNKYAKIHEHVLLDMLSPIELPDGSIVAERHNPSVPDAVLRQIWEWKQQGATPEDVIDRLRPRTVPAGYVPHPWSPGKSESLKDKLRSILAQFAFKHCLNQWRDRGVDFTTYLYVPEVHSETKQVFCEREDEAHVLKRIANHTRSGGPAKLNLEHYVEALSDPASGLSYPVLTGVRKQSVVDAERFFGQSLAQFMQRKGYKYEEKFIQTISDWRRACDHRGLTELQRCRFNYRFLNLILDELMPWHRQRYDFSDLEVNRPINNVLGFSRETLVAVTTNIEGREWRRRNTTGSPEHPRASTSDDVECFFSMLRDAIGKNFTSKQVQFSFRKVCLEFCKRLDPDLPFYYHTSSHTRYSEGPLPNFSQPVTKAKRKSKRLPRREQTAAFAGRRAVMPVHGSLAVRAKFHNQPIELPPPPSSPVCISEHSYA